MVSVRVRVSCRSGVSVTSVKDVIDSLRFEHRCINLLHPGHLATQKLLSQLGFGVTCLDLCPPVLAGTSGGEIPPYLAIVGDSLCSSACHFHASQIFGKCHTPRYSCPDTGSLHFTPTWVRVRLLRVLWVRV